MTDAKEPNPPVDAAHMRALARKLIIPHVLLTGAIIAATLWFVLYGMKGEGGKDSGKEAASLAGECAASAALAPKLAALAKGDIAALAMAAKPKPMPELAFSGNASPTSLAAFRGKTLLLNLWATWCVPCREEMPALDRLQGQSGGKDFEVVAINIDTARLERPKAFLQEIGVKNLTFYADSTAKAFQTLQQTGQIVGLPTSILVGPDGCALGQLSGPARWDGADALAMIKAAAQ